VFHTSGTVHEGYKLRYRAAKFDCEACALKMQCCPKAPSREVPRDVREYAREVIRRLTRRKAFLKSRNKRKRVEMRLETNKWLGSPYQNHPNSMPPTEQPTFLSKVSTLHVILLPSIDALQYALSIGGHM
jgi:hypothetical protein